MKNKQTKNYFHSINHWFKDIDYFRNVINLLFFLLYIAFATSLFHIISSDSIVEFTQFERVVFAFIALVLFYNCFNFYFEGYFKVLYVLLFISILFNQTPLLYFTAYFFFPMCLMFAFLRYVRPDLFEVQQ